MTKFLRHEVDQAKLKEWPGGFYLLDDVKVYLEKVYLIGFTDKDLYQAILKYALGRLELKKDDLNRSLIRAKAGHSVAVNLDYQVKTPPEALYHASSANTLDLIMLEGLKPMTRQFVHLFALRDLAVNRAIKKDKPLVYEINALKASLAGVSFYQVSENVWLVKHLPPIFIKKHDYLDPRTTQHLRKPTRRQEARRASSTWFRQDHDLVRGHEPGQNQAQAVD